MLDAAEDDLGGQAGGGEFAAGGGLLEELSGLVTEGLGIGEGGGQGGPVRVGEDAGRVVGDGGADVSGEGAGDLRSGAAVGEGGQLVGGGLVVDGLKALDGLPCSLGVAAGLVPAADEDHHPHQGRDHDGEGVAVGPVTRAEDVAGGSAQVGGALMVGADLGALGAGERPGGRPQFGPQLLRGGLGGGVDDVAQRGDLRLPECTVPFATGGAVLGEVLVDAVEEVQALLDTARQRRNSARWIFALALGLCQGEVLGLQWKDVDFDRGIAWVRRGRLHPKYAHGCGDRCGRKPGFCPQKVAVRRETKDTRSRASRRPVPLPEPLAVVLRHQEEQDRERALARDLWVEKGYVFTDETGQPLNPSTDYHHWKRLLREAGIRDGRLHDARHTASTVLLLLSVPERIVMAIMGWSSASMAKRYQHVTDPMLQDVGRKIGGLLWDVAPGRLDMID
ncbi:tyrosine-type recombinase/integrase [Kitasatospora phosalacinea]|uniref:tyrosine-type recombinase/integrase n=1 Tax=Kitasatospora phosalacinea TaxID=2065 RepID=UPI00365A4F75